MIQKFVLNFFITLFLSSVISSENQQDCTFDTHLSGSRKKGENQIEILKGKRFTVEDSDADGYKYDIGVCVDALSPSPEGVDINGVGVLQIRKDKPDDKPIVIGRYDKADIMAGPEWVKLEYRGGQAYGSHCKNDPGRRAEIMFICDPDKLEEVPILLEEQRNKTESCYYLFEIGTSAVCPKQPLITIGLSVGSALLIVFFALAAVYLIGGFLYNRFVLGAKGLEQIPNYRFWEDFGNLQADGCDLVCRSRKSKEPKTYKGIGDDQLQEDEERHHDEHLLPM